MFFHFCPGIAHATQRRQLRTATPKLFNDSKSVSCLCAGWDLRKCRSLQSSSPTIFQLTVTMDTLILRLQPWTETWDLSHISCMTSGKPRALDFWNCSTHCEAHRKLHPICERRIIPPLIFISLVYFNGKIVRNGTAPPYLLHTAPRTMEPWSRLEHPSATAILITSDRNLIRQSNLIL